MGSGSRARLAVSLAAPVLALLGCGGGTSPGAGRSGTAVDDSAVAAWAGDAPAPPAEARARGRRAAPAEPIELAGGERFEMLLALSRVRPKPAGDTHCSLYALRASEDGLQEGRATVSCDAGLAGAAEQTITFEPVPAPRLAHLRAVLSGARPATDAVSERAKQYGAGAQYRITVRIVTSRRRIEGRVPPVEWPPPGAEQREPALGRKPLSLSEVWEAVMFPHRFVPPPA